MITNHLDVYEFHGVSFNGQSTDKELVASCPFCGKDSHFYVNKKKGLFDCKHCGKAGNGYTFLQYLHDQCLSSTTKNQYSSLSRHRSLPSSAFSDAEIAYDPSLQRWLIPVRNSKGTMINLRCWSPRTQNILGTKSCEASLFGKILDSGPIYICEGEWDAVALEWLLYKNKISKASIVAVPGANTFKESWAENLGNRAVVFLYDNDRAGRDGMEKAIKTLHDLPYSMRPSSIKVIEWPESFPDKYDIRDLVSRHRKDPEKGWQLLQSFFVDYDSLQKVHAAPSTDHTFNSVVSVFRKHVYVNKEFKDALALCCAIIHSSKLQGHQNPLWLFLVGPPSCGKTLILKCFRTCPNSFYRSRVTSKTLVSGFRTEDGSDPSIIRKMIGRCFILKDFTEIITLPISEQEQIYGVLRGFFDGFVQVSYGNNLYREYDGYCSILAGVTPTIHKQSRVSLGERFLKYQMIRYGYDQERHVRRSLEKELTTEEESILQGTISDFMARPVTEDDLPEITKDHENKIIALSQVIAHLRATVERNRDDVLYRPYPEIGSRLSKQLIKLMQCLSIVYGVDVPDEACYDLVERVALDTATGWPQDVCIEISRHKEGIAKSNICDNLQISHSSVERSLNDLLDLGVIRYKKMESQTGRPARIWRLSPYMAKQWRRAGLHTSNNLKVWERHTAH